ncbi:hypothetical protein SCHPADRAFT_947878 [Schizopora paradoxa]|uniref:Sulfotransferase domain-containing protein n=1 Tax=Schizopora paradoxa TaxID=27342 RepID=A0A0H2QX84_9AGAM|nr:hypothetical protein SCHPADRAFT_947878 [Schizopora paradoxa]
MGRQRKYKSEEEVIQARRNACTRYYAMNRTAVLSRRQERRQKLAKRPSPSPSCTEESDSSPLKDSSPSPIFVEELMTLSDSSECFKCRLPMTIARQLKRARRYAPVPSRVEDSCAHWKRHLTQVTRGMESSGFLYLVYKDLLTPPFRGFLKLYEYLQLEMSIELTEEMVDDTIRFAYDRDPSGQNQPCQMAEELRSLLEQTTIPLRDLIESHRYGDLKVLRATAAEAFERNSV